jgi:hypothetical protein
MMDYLAWFLAALADFQRIIEYFGIGAVFIWLYFLERGDRVKHDEGEGIQAQWNIDLITKYYQTSWLFFGIAVLAEYALSEEWLTNLFGTWALGVVNYIAIIFGLVMFAVPSYVVYKKISGHRSYAAISIPEITHVLYAALLALIHAALLWGLFTIGVTLTTRGQVFAATFGLSYLGIAVSFTRWGKVKGWHARLVFTLIGLPWITLATLIVLTLLGWL